MQGPPRIARRYEPDGDSPDRGIARGPEGETVRITCDAFAIPPPEGIAWSQHGFAITSGSGGFDRLEERSTGIIVYAKVREC